MSTIQDNDAMALLIGISERLGKMEGFMESRTDILNLIHQETKKTNGRVTALEEKFNQLQVKQSFKTGYITAIATLCSSLVAIIIPLIKPLLTKITGFIPQP